MGECYCDYERPVFYDMVVRKARKEHKCCECGMPIKEGERYENLTAMWEVGDGLSHLKTCPDCVMIREALSEMECFCWSHEGLMEDIVNQFREAEFSPGLRFAYLRLLATHRRRLYYKRRK